MYYIRWNYILDEMKLKKITNTKIAQLLEVNRDTWNKWKAEKTDITLKKFLQLLQILDLSFNDVVKDRELNTCNLSNNIKKFKELKVNKTNTRFNSIKK